MAWNNEIAVNLYVLRRSPFFAVSFAWQADRIKAFFSPLAPSSSHWWRCLPKMCFMHIFDSPQREINTSFSYENITEESHKYFPRRWRRGIATSWGRLTLVCRSGSGPLPRQPWVMSYFMPRGCCCACPSSTHPLVKGGYGWSISITVNIKTRDRSGLLKSFEKARKWPSKGRFLPGLRDPTCLVLWTSELSALIKGTCALWHSSN